MNFYKYENEINNIIDQNPSEYDLYPLIKNVLNFVINKELSIRLTGPNRLTTTEQRFCSISAVPDLSILSDDFKYGKEQGHILGVVEVKCYKENLDKKEFLSEVLGELLSYSKVIYTNGLEWRYYEYKAKSEKDKHSKKALDELNEKYIRYKLKLYSLPYAQNRSEDEKAEYEKINDEVKNIISNINKKLAELLNIVDINSKPIMKWSVKLKGANGKLSKKNYYKLLYELSKINWYKK